MRCSPTPRSRSEAQRPICSKLDAPPAPHLYWCRWRGGARCPTPTLACYSLSSTFSPSLLVPVEHAGGGRARHRGGAEASGAVQPAGVRAGRGDAAVARAEPRRAHGVPGREPVPGGAAPGAGGLRRRLHHHRPRAPRPARGGPRRRVPARPEPALLRLPPRHQRPPQPALRRVMGRHPRRRPARVGRPFPSFFDKAAKLQFLGGSQMHAARFTGTRLRRQRGCRRYSRRGCWPGRGRG
jgi:hypothetical protein